ncbi:hypothetical protein SP41_92 [Salmonella phage 41]|nr:hypothetical protein SP41_92 [Salmonella phage 41]
MSFRTDQAVLERSGVIVKVHTAVELVILGARYRFLYH